MSTSDTQAEGDGFIFRFGTHPGHLVAPQERMLVSEIKKIIAQHVQGFDPASDLVLEDPGDEPDRQLANADEVDIVDVPHFYGAAHQRDFRIIVNGDAKIVHTRELSFDEIVKIAYPNPKPAQDVRYTVTYKRAVRPKHQGHLHAGESVVIRKDGTIFDVVRTYKS